MLPKKANVSIATVSRVLHNLGGYSDQTKQKGRSGHQRA
ncbi:LacI family DNA-binding transcriptional regulator [Paenibacillus rhizoplanae]